MVWHEIEIPANLVGEEHGRATKIYTPKAYSENCSFFMPTKLVQVWGGTAVLAYCDDFTWTLSEADFDNFGRPAGWVKREVGVAEFLEIWENVGREVHHIPPKLTPEVCEAAPELIDD